MFDNFEEWDDIQVIIIDLSGPHSAWLRPVQFVQIFQVAQGLVEDLNQNNC